VGDIAAEIGKSAAEATRGSAGSALNETYVRSVRERCIAITTGRYPFVADGPNVQDVLIQDFADLFGYGGVFETFFNTHLVNFVDTNRQPWQPRPGAPSGVPLEQFQQAQRIREVFFPRGSRTPQVTFGIGFTQLSSDQFTLEVDGAPSIRFAHEAYRTRDVSWPGPKGLAVATFIERTGRNLPVKKEGSWALFKLIEAGNLKREAPDKYLLTLTQANHSVTMRIEATRVDNPFGDIRGLFRGFRCGG
jgi:type VI secretion system protein ImpL